MSCRSIRFVTQSLIRCIIRMSSVGFESKAYTIRSSSFHQDPRVGSLRQQQKTTEFWLHKCGSCQLHILPYLQHFARDRRCLGYYTHWYQVNDRSCLYRHSRRGFEADSNNSNLVRRGLARWFKMLEKLFRPGYDLFIVGAYLVVLKRPERRIAKPLSALPCGCRSRRV